MKLYHYTTRHALNGIIREGFIYPIYDAVWFTNTDDGEMTAGKFMPTEHQARVVVETDNVHWFHDVYEEFAYLHLGMLNLITDTSNWYVSFDAIPAKCFVAIEVLNEKGEWTSYEAM
jgi:hypothetical protein